MFNQLDRSVVPHCIHIGQSSPPARISHDIAKQIARAYSWSWVTCWFAGTGQIGHPIMGEQFAQDPVGRMMHALFGWWHKSAANPDGMEYEDGEVSVVTAMNNYLFHRVRGGDTGPVEGWEQL